MRTEILFTNLSIEKMYMYLHMYTCGYMNYIHICVHIDVLFLRGFFIERHVFILLYVCISMYILSMYCIFMPYDMDRRFPKYWSCLGKVFERWYTKVQALHYTFDSCQWLGRLFSYSLHHCISLGTLCRILTAHVYISSTIRYLYTLYVCVGKRLVKLVIITLKLDLYKL